MGEKETTERASKESQELKFDYVKSHYFRVIHADGVWGGVSPRGNIHMSFYNERTALPDVSKLTLTGEGQIPKPEQYKASSAIVREFEADVILDLATARSLSTWLNDKIKLLEDLVREAKKVQQQAKQKADKDGGTKMAHEG